MSLRQEVGSDPDSAAADEAEAFEDALRNSPAVPQRLDLDNPRLASVLRLMSEVFVTSDTRSIDGTGGSIHDVIPENLGRFRIRSKIGSGGFASVYLAHDDLLHRDVAIKAIRWESHLCDEPRRLAEARAVARLSHPNLVPLYEIFEADGFVCLVSEYCSGPTLSKWMAENADRIDFNFAAHLVAQIADGVAHAHSRGVVHRDIKPSNILLSQGESRSAGLQAEPSATLTPRLTDFGLASDFQRSETAGSSNTWGGTLRYTAPEQFLQDPKHYNGPGCDIYALGVVLYRMLCNRYPHDESNAVKLVKAICESAPTAIRSLRPTVPRDLEAICLRCLHKDPSQRYANAADLVDDLKRFRRGEEVFARRRSSAERFSRHVAAHPIVSASFGLFVLILVIGLVFLNRSNESLKENGRQLSNAVQDARDQKRIAEDARQTALSAAKRLAIRQAYNSLVKDDLPAARSLLASSDAFKSSQSQGLDERLLRHLISNRPLQPTPQSASIEEIVYIPSRELFAVAGIEGVVRLHRSSDGLVVDQRRFEPNVSIRALAVSGDGNLLAIGKAAKPELVGNVSNDIVFWALDDRKPPDPLLDFPTSVETLAFSPDGHRLAVGIRYEPMQIVDLTNPQSRRVIENARRCEDLAWSDDGSRLLLTPETGTLRLCDSKTGKIAADFKAVAKVHRFAWSPDQRWIAYTVALKPVLYVLDTHAPGKPAIELTHRNGIAQSIRFSNDSMHLYCGLISGHLLKWEASDFEAGNSMPIREVAADVFGVMDGEVVSALAVSDNGNLMAGSASGNLSLFTGDLQDAARRGRPSGTNAAVLSKDGRFAITGHESGAVTQVMLTSSDHFPLLPAGDSPVAHIALSNDSNLLVIGWTDCTIALIDLDDRKVVHREQVPLPQENTPAALTNLVLSTSNEHLLVVLNQTLLHCYRISRGENPIASPVGQPIEVDMQRWIAASLDQDAALLFSEQITRVDLRRAKLQRLSNNPVAGYSDGCGVADSISGSIITGGHDGRLRRFVTAWNSLETSLRWEPAVAVDQSVRAITAVAISPDGKYIFTGSDKGDVALWESDRLLHIGEIAVGNEKGPITNIGISDDQKTILFHQDAEHENLNDFKSGLNIIRLSDSELPR